MFGRRKFIHIILVGTLFVNAMLCVLLFNSYFLEGNQYVASRIFTATATMGYLGLAYLLFRRGKHGISGMMLIGIYLGVAAIISSIWGINAPFGIPLYAFVILLGGVMFGSKYIIPAASVVVLIIFLLQTLTMLEILQPQTSILSRSSVFGDVAAYSIIFGIFALLGWLAVTELEVSLDDAHRAHQQLVKQKRLLEDDLETEKIKLKHLHLKELSRSYAFVKLGQQTTMLLHDIANQLSLLNLDFHTKRMKHDDFVSAKKTIAYLNDVITNATRRINSDSHQAFAVAAVVYQVVNDLHDSARRKKVKIITTIPNDLIKVSIIGNAEKLRQIILILTSNALQSYEKKRGLAPKVFIALRAAKDGLEISVKDIGIGIDEAKRRTIFQPQDSRKRNGHGVGLYIAHRVIEDHFKGCLALDSRQDCTKFIVYLPYNTA